MRFRNSGLKTPLEEAGRVPDSALEAQKATSVPDSSEELESKFHGHRNLTSEHKQLPTFQMSEIYLSLV